jgi:hypothetical protein
VPPNTLIGPTCTVQLSRSGDFADRLTSPIGRTTTGLPEALAARWSTVNR